MCSEERHISSLKSDARCLPALCVGMKSMNYERLLYRRSIGQRSLPAVAFSCQSLWRMSKLWFHVFNQKRVSEACGLIHIIPPCHDTCSRSSYVSPTSFDALLVRITSTDVPSPNSIFHICHLSCANASISMPSLYVITRMSLPVGFSENLHPGISCHQGNTLMAVRCRYPYISHRKIAEIVSYIKHSSMCNVSGF